MVSHYRGAETSISALHEGYLRAFVTLDAIATALGQWLLWYRYEANLAGGLVVAVFGSRLGTTTPAQVRPVDALPPCSGKIRDHRLTSAPRSPR